MVWTGAQAFVAGGHRLFGWSEGTGTLLIGCIIVSVITAIVAIMGHKVVVLFEKIGTYLVGSIVILSVFIFASKFNVSYEGGHYVLGGFGHLGTRHAGNSFGTYIVCTICWGL